MKKEKKAINLKDVVSDGLSGLSEIVANDVPDDVIKSRTEFYKERFMHHGYDDREPYNLRVISEYCAELYSGTSRSQKGLCLMGLTGRGKTLAFSIMKKLFRLRVYQAADLVELWQVHGVKNRYEIYELLKGNYSDRGQPAIDVLWRDRCIDDIGTEPILNEFGTKQEVIDTIIQKCCNEFRDCGARTHMAVNLTPKMFIERYGVRAESRLHQMCHVVTLRGNDRRRD